MAGRLLSPIDTSTFPGQFGARLRQLRLRRYATIGQFLDALAEQGVTVNPQAVIKWEHGKNSPPLSRLPQIAAALGVKVETLFSRLPG